ncbi:hypothetical protein CRG98_025833 [Punica granatum]|uniref:Uncharacterized protein n=2 Tax=Punica granatum TaxID=22663 RepID=A0A2I0JC13_PUNGR|nr:hypothetical protein CRG98_025833 [Punica granatum]
MRRYVDFAKEHPERVPRGLTFNQDLLPTLQQIEEILVRLERATQALESLEWVHEDYRPKRIPTFNGSMNAKEFLAWISDVDRFFNYYGIPLKQQFISLVILTQNSGYTWLGGAPRQLPHESEDCCMKSAYPLKNGKTNAFLMTIADVEEKVQLEDAYMKSDKLKEEEVESKNEAAQASQDNNVMIEKGLAIGKMLREELISNFAEKVQAELILNPGQVELQEEIAIEDLSMVFHPIEAKFAKAYTTPLRKQQFRERVGYRGNKKKSVYEEL